MKSAYLLDDARSWHPGAARAAGDASREGRGVARMGTPRSAPGATHPPTVGVFT